MIFKVDPTNGTPVYEQIARQLTFAVACGALKSGEMIPSVRQLARDLAVNPNTVSRAYRELQDAGIVTTLRGTGMQIAQGAARKCTATRKDYIKSRIRAVISEARQSQMDDDEIKTFFQTELSRPNRHRKRKQESTTGSSRGEAS